MITDEQLAEWARLAKLDDWHRQITKGDVQQMIAELQRISEASKHRTIHYDDPRVPAAACAGDCIIIDGWVADIVGAPERTLCLDGSDLPFGPVMHTSIPAREQYRAAVEDAAARARIATPIPPGASAEDTDKLVREHANKRAAQLTNTTDDDHG